MDIKYGLLEDFRAIREEMISIFHARVWGTITYIVITGGIVAIKEFNIAKYVFLIYVAIPLLLHTAHRERARIRIGNYIRNIIEPQIPGLFWENYLSIWRRVNTKKSKKLNFIDRWFHILGLTGVYLIIVCFSTLNLIYKRENEIYLIIGAIGFVFCIFTLLYFDSIIRNANIIFEQVKYEMQKEKYKFLLNNNELVSKIKIDITKYDTTNSKTLTYFLKNEDFNQPIETLDRLKDKSDAFQIGDFQIKLTENQNDKLLNYLRNNKYYLTDYGKIEDSEYILAFSFGVLIAVNIELADILEKLIEKYSSKIFYVQWEIADLLIERDRKYKNQINKINLDYDQNYISTLRVVEKFVEMVRVKNNSIPIKSFLIAQSWHAPRCIKICEDKGIKVVGGKFIDAFSINDPQSWVRNAFAWILKESTQYS